MNRTFTIVSPHFLSFTDRDWFVWFHLKLVAILPSFNPEMLKNATSNINCTNYHVVWVAFNKQARSHCTKVENADCVRMLFFFCFSFLALCSVSGMAKAFPAMKSGRREGIAEVLLGYLRKSASVINEPGRADAVNCATWLLVWTWTCERIGWNGIERKTGTWLVPCASRKNNAC